MSPRIGSLFSGYGGLEMGVQAVVGGETVWHVEFDPAPSRILEHRFPGVPNFGDITTVDWSAVEPVDVLTGGFPCQDVSLAGLRRGLKEGTRSGLWSEFAQAIGHLRPGLVVIENVRGLLSAVAAGPVESDPWGLGDGAARPSLRALGAVLGDLADLGYDTRWCGVRAADAGAPHGRFRVFIVANPAGQPWRVGHGNDVQARRGALRREPAAGRASVEDAYLAARGEWGQSAPGQAQEWRARADTGGRGGTLASDARSDESERRGVGGDMGSAPSADEGAREERERVRDAASDRRSTASDTERGGWAGGSRTSGRVSDDGAVAGWSGEGSVAWGPYGAAISRWERVLRRVAPSPTEATGRAGAQRLSPVFVEFMMGLPAGWLTAPEVGLTRAQQLKALGNGVVPQQAELAVRMLLQAEAVAA